MEKTYKTFKTKGIDWLQRYVDPEDEVIDFGCGLMPVTRSLKCKKLIGIDAWLPYVDQLRKELSSLKHIYLWHLELDGQLLSVARSGSIDVSLAIDVVEHFKKNGALSLIRQIERISRKWVVIFTPNGFLPQERKDNREYQLHRCGFVPTELEDIGYDIFIRTNERGPLPSFLAAKDLSSGDAK